MQANTPVYLKLLANLGLALGLPLPTAFARVPGLGNLVSKISRTFPMFADWLDGSLMKDQPLKALMDEYLDTEGLMRGLPLYVLVYESQGGLADAWRCLVAETEPKDTPPSQFLHIQAMPEQGRRNALLASAAIPLLHEARQIGDAHYTDGGQGGWQTVQGNTPMTPLIEAGCKQVIVTHLNDGSLWSRHDFPDVTVLEIRPQSPITPDSSLLGGAKAALGFDSSNIARLMEQGYRDTHHCIGRVMRAINTRHELRQSEHALDDNLRQGSAADEALADAMSRLR